jgi:hypothetical protein
MAGIRQRNEILEITQVHAGLTPFGNRQRL